MRFSVIIPVYNQSEYLSQAIDSVLAQTHKPHEIIVVIDGSPDNSYEVAARYPQVTILSQINKGLASARNSGIMFSTGDYIYPLDADDIMLPNCLDRIRQVAEGSDADIVAPSFREFGISNREVILMPNPTFADFKIANRIGYFSAIKRQALLEIGGYSPKMVWGWEDYALWVNLLHEGKRIVTIPEVLVLYRTKQQSMIHEANAHAEELIAQMKKDFPTW